MEPLECSSIKQGPHVVVFPYPVQGHMNPLMEFSKRLASKNLRVTFVTTEAIRERMLEAQDGNLRFHDIRIETISDGRPSNFDRSKDREMGSHLLRTVGKMSFERLIQNLNAEGESVSCIIYDSFADWIPEIGSKFNIPLAFFWTQSCAVYSIYYHCHKGLVKVGDEAEKGDNVSFQGLPELRVQDLPSFLHPSDPYKSVLRIVLDQFTPISQATWVLGNSFHELETTEIKSMDSLIPIRTVGPLIPSAFLDGNDLQETDVGVNLWKTVDCMDWLNTKGRSTVIYVSFGSLAVLSKGQIQEIALGLKDCGHPFLWVIRPADKKDEDKSSQLDLPEDFAEETVDRGLIVAWCTQKAVLCHPSVGLFITHCGWNSTLESLSTGVPVLALPQWSDQTTNSKYVEDKWKTGIRLNTTEDGLLARKELEMSIKKIMEGEAGVEVRKNALRWKKSAREAMMNGGSSNKCIEDFVEELSVTALSRPLDMFKK